MLKDTLNKGISTPIAIAIVLILVIVVGGFTWWQYGETWREANELPEIELPEKEEIEIPEKAINIQELLSDKEVNGILMEFAEKKTISFNDIGADKILLDALEFKNGEIKNRLQVIKTEIEGLSNEIQDAPDMRSWFTQRVKICIAESIIYDDIKSILKYCGYEEATEPINLETVDDLTATEQVLPHFLTGFAYYSENNNTKADYYYEQIKLHHAELEKYGYVSAPYLDLYNKIYNKIKGSEKIEEVKNFEECVAKGYPILESYPRQCKAPDGDTFIEEVEREITGWQAYRNEEYGFEIDYPLGWSYKIVSERQIEFREKGKTYWLEGSDTYAIGIFIYENPNNLTAEQIAEERKSKAGWPVEIKTLTINNIDTAQAIDYLQQETIIVKNRQEYKIVIPNGLDKSVSEIYDKMTSTFKFID